jgi:hypothetical protein
MSDSDVPKKLENKIVWDAAEGGDGPEVKDGVFYPKRRSFLATFGTIALAALGVLAARGVTQSSHDFPRNDADVLADHHNTTANHTDLCCPHADGAPHSDFNTSARKPSRPGSEDRNSKIG